MLEAKGRKSSKDLLKKTQAPKELTNEDSTRRAILAESIRLQTQVEEEIAQTTEELHDELFEKQGTWKLYTVNEVEFEEVKRRNRDYQVQTIDDKDVSDEEKVTEVKEEETNEEESVEAMVSYSLDDKDPIFEMVINVPWFINQTLATPELMANCQCCCLFVAEKIIHVAVKCWPCCLKDLMLQISLVMISRVADRSQEPEAHNEDTQRNLKFTSEDQVRGGLLGIIVNRLKSGSYRVKSGRHS
ncbi:hypothetical protein Tco_0615261 [Tanacetum coccineum]